MAKTTTLEEPPPSKLALSNVHAKPSSAAPRASRSVAAVIRSTHFWTAGGCLVQLLRGRAGKEGTSSAVALLCARAVEATIAAPSGRAHTLTVSTGFLTSISIAPSAA